MWNFTDKDEKNIEDIYQYFLPKFPEIDKEVLHNRIFCGYCWGEGRLPIINIDDWNNYFIMANLRDFSLALMTGMTI